MIIHDYKDNLEFSAVQHRKQAVGTQRENDHGTDLFAKSVGLEEDFTAYPPPR